MKDPLENWLKEVNNKALSLCLQSYSISDMDIIGREENGGTFAFCIVVDQYSRRLTKSSPFLVMLMRNWTVLEVRQAIFEKILQAKIEYRYGSITTNNGSNESIYREITEEQKLNFMMYYIDYQTSRR